MTKFIDKTKESLVKKSKQTVFERYLEEDMTIKDNSNGSSVESWGTIEFIGSDLSYGDVFKAYDDDANIFTLFFGTKGDEFD